MAQRGGARPGAGRKPGGKNRKTIEQEMALEVLREEIRKHWDELIQAKLNLAKGIYEERQTPQGGVYIYKKAPDSASLEYLFSVVVGKPQDRLEVSMPNSLIEILKNAIRKD